MTDLMAARATMGFSLGFHIIFASIGMTMPFMMSVAHFLYLRRKRPASQGALILFGWYFVHAPNTMTLKSGYVSFFEAAAPTATLVQLVIALVVGSCFIFPSLFYLLKVFKSEIQT